MKVRRITARVSRGEGGARHYDDFTLDVEPRMTVLDALFRIQQGQDASLSFRCACRVGMCGSCAVSVNSVPALACRTPLESLETDCFQIEPLPHLPVLKDLIVDLAPFFDQWKRILPAFRPRRPEAAQPALIPPNSQSARLTQGRRDCITCGACFAACGIRGLNRLYLGPAAINRALQRIADPRESAGEDRLQILDDASGGVWRCRTQFSCTSVCPKGIDLTESILTAKRGLLRSRKFLRRFAPSSEEKGSAS